MNTEKMINNILTKKKANSFTEGIVTNTIGGYKTNGQFLGPRQVLWKDNGKNDVLPIQDPEMEADMYTQIRNRNRRR
jgi:hypothetical protein